MVKYETEKMRKASVRNARKAIEMAVAEAEPDSYAKSDRLVEEWLDSLAKLAAEADGQGVDESRKNKLYVASADVPVAKDVASTQANAAFVPKDAGTVDAGAAASAGKAN